MSSEAWKQCGKACGWERKEKYCNMCKIKKEFKTCSKCGSYSYKMEIVELLWKRHALRFHEINLTEGWSPAIQYLLQVTNSKE